MAPIVDIAESTSSDDEPLSHRQVQGKVLELSSDSDADSGDDEAEGTLLPGTETDDEQDDKEIEAIPFPACDQPADRNELRALVIQDLKTEDPKQRGGYARRWVGSGSVVLIRGADDSGATATWVALVKKMYRQRSKLMADITWFIRKGDVPRNASGRALLSDDPRQLLLTNDDDTVDARYIRHPAHAWVLNGRDPLPVMRCGQGQLRHSRQRPGFIVRRVYDKPRNRVIAIGPELVNASRPLAAVADRLLQCTQADLERLRGEEADFDKAQGLEGVEAGPFGLAEAEAEAEVEAEEAPPTSSSSSDSSDSESDTDLVEAAAAQQQQRAAEAVRQRLRAMEAAQQREQQVAARRQAAQEAVDADAAKLAQLLPQQAPSSPGGSQEGAGASPQAALGWRKAAQQLLRQAGELPRRAVQQAGRGGSGGGSGGLEAKEVEAMVEAGIQPNLGPLAVVLRAICDTTPAAVRDLLDQLAFVRALIAWLWHLIALQQKREAQDPEVGACLELLLRSLERCPYTARVHHWVKMALGPGLISLLAANRGGMYTASVQKAADELKALWRSELEKLQTQERLRKRQKEEVQRKEAAQDRQDRKLLQQSPQAAAGLSLATGGRRPTALGAGGGGAMYVRPKQSPQTAGLRGHSASPSAAKLPAAARPPSSKLPPVPERPIGRRLSLADGLQPSQDAAQQRQQQQGRQQVKPLLQQQPKQPSQQPHQPVQQQLQPPKQQQQQQQPSAKQPLRPPIKQQLPPSAKRPPPLQQPSQQLQQPDAKPAVQLPKAKADLLNSMWMDAFKDNPLPSPRQQQPQQPVNRSTTMPQAAAAEAAEEEAAPNVSRSFSAPEWQQQQEPPAAAGQKRPAPIGSPPEGGGGMRAAKQARHEGVKEAAQHKRQANKGSKLAALVKKGSRGK